MCCVWIQGVLYGICCHVPNDHSWMCHCRVGQLAGDVPLVRLDKSILSGQHLLLSLQGDSPVESAAKYRWHPSLQPPKHHYSKVMGEESGEIWAHVSCQKEYFTCREDKNQVAWLLVGQQQCCEGSQHVLEFNVPWCTAIIKACINSQTSFSASVCADVYKSFQRACSKHHSYFWHKCLLPQ